MRKTIVLIALFAGACQQAPQAVENNAAAEATTPVAAAPTAAEATISENYSCDNGKTVQAVYDNSDADQGRLTLTIDGKSYPLTIAISASGARYTGEQGPTPGNLIEWWTKGDDASWSEAPLGDSAKQDDTKLVAQCAVKH